MNQKITIFTGSGASYGCGLVTPHNPPLGRDLYSQLESYAPQIMSRVSAIVGRNNIDNFEMKMHEMQNKGVNAVVLNSMIATYFSQFSPNICGNSYVELFRTLNTGNINFVYSTLNYDCIAELAASAIGMQVNYDLNTIPSNQFDVLKLHGSCNFLLSGITGPLGGISMGIGGGMIDGHIEVVQPAQVPTLIQNRPAGPCMSFYMKDKPTPVGASTIKAIQQRWEYRILESDKIIIIGANVNKEDYHVWGPISKTKAKIGFVGSISAYSSLKSLNSSIDATHISTNFSSSVSSISQFI